MKSSKTGSIVQDSAPQGDTFRRGAGMQVLRAVLQGGSHRKLGAASAEGIGCALVGLYSSYSLSLV